MILTKIGVISFKNGGFPVYALIKKQFKCSLFLYLIRFKPSKA